MGRMAAEPQDEPFPAGALGPAAVHPFGPPPAGANLPCDFHVSGGGDSPDFLRIFVLPGLRCGVPGVNLIIQRDMNNFIYHNPTELVFGKGSDRPAFETDPRRPADHDHLRRRQRQAQRGLTSRSCGLLDAVIRRVLGHRTQPVGRDAAQACARQGAGGRFPAGRRRRLGD